MSGMVYADYNYYTQNYLGTMLNEEDFSRLALRASSFLDYYTRGRAAQNAELEAVKMACCAVAEQQHVIEKARALAVQSMSAATAGGEIQSETVGPFSRTYRSGGDSASGAFSAEKTAEAALAEVAQRYLAHTGLLYRGGGCCV